MTVKEVANVLQVTPKTIRKYIKKLYPYLMENGYTTNLNEVQVTRVKSELYSNPYLNRAVQERYVRRVDVEIIQKSNI